MHTLFIRIITSCALIAFFCTIFFLPAFVFSTILAAALIYIIWVELPPLYKPYRSVWQVALILYPTIPIILLILLNHDDSYRFIVPVLFALVSAFDTGAYFTGITIGSHPIAPTISPQKTWEGLAGGILSSLLICIMTIGLYRLFFLQEAFVVVSHHAMRDVTLMVMMSISTSICAFAGDLFESWLKRRAQVKDSGSLLPGHGGLLDRFDSLFCAIIFFYSAKKAIVLLFNSSFSW